jgi:hypothetical protein
LDFENLAVLGLGDDHGILLATQGCDGNVMEDDYDYQNMKPVRDDAFTPEERREIADYMIKQWERWATKGEKT